MAARACLAEPQAAGAHGCLGAAFALADPHAVAGVVLRGELPENHAALQRGRARPRAPHAPLFAAPAIAYCAGLDRLQCGGDLAAATALPQPPVRASILQRDEIAERAAGNVATRRKRPLRLGRAWGAFFHEWEMGAPGGFLKRRGGRQKGRRAAGGMPRNEGRQGRARLRPPTMTVTATATAKPQPQPQPPCVFSAPPRYVRFLTLCFNLLHLLKTLAPQAFSASSWMEGRIATRREGEDSGLGTVKGFINGGTQHEDRIH